MKNSPPWPAGAVSPSFSVAPRIFLRVDALPVAYCWFRHSRHEILVGVDPDFPTQTKEARVNVPSLVANMIVFSSFLGGKPINEVITSKRIKH